MGKSISRNINIAKPITASFAKTDSKLFDEGPPDPSRGLLGIGFAHGALAKIGRVGLLFGGVAKENFYSRNSLENLDSHKDVDVIVLRRKGEEGDQIPSFEKFYNGIDWWEHISLESSHQGDDRGGYVNGNSVLLKFGATLRGNHRPGLYIPGTTILNSINEIEYGETFTNDHPSFYYPFINLPRLLKNSVDIYPIHND